MTTHRNDIRDNINAKLARITTANGYRFDLTTANFGYRRQRIHEASGPFPYIGIQKRMSRTLVQNPKMVHAVWELELHCIVNGNGATPDEIEEDVEDQVDILTEDLIIEFMQHRNFAVLPNTAGPANSIDFVGMNQPSPEPMPEGRRYFVLQFEINYRFKYDRIQT